MRLFFRLMFFLFLISLSTHGWSETPIWRRSIQEAHWILNSPFNHIVTPSDIDSFFIKSDNPLVVVFLSVRCPSSNNHLKEVQYLHSRFNNQFQFLIVHSNRSVSLKQAQTVFLKKGIEIPILSDEGMIWTTALKVVKTPHAFVINKKNVILYQGGISNSSKIESADVFFLRLALSQISRGEKVKIPTARTLGCIIEREENQNVW